MAGAVLSGEAAAWAAAGPHLELPGELTALVANLERVDGEREGIAAELGPVSAAEQIVAGTAANDALDLDGAAREAAERATEARHAVAQAVRIARGQVDRWVEAHRDHLIGDIAAPAVEALLADAVVAAEALAPFGPAFHPTRIAAEAGPEQLAAWRDSRRADQALAAIRAAWACTWRAATTGAPRSGRPPRALHPGPRPGGVHTWADPWAVGDLDVRDGLATDVLRIASWHEAGHYRLAGITELVELARRVTLVHPQVGRERNRRRVLLPAEPDNRPTPRSMAV